MLPNFFRWFLLAGLSLRFAQAYYIDASCGEKWAQTIENSIVEIRTDIASKVVALDKSQTPVEAFLRALFGTLFRTAKDKGDGEL
jgi:glycerol-3-phosphate O-acyltransferase